MIVEPFGAYRQDNIYVMDMRGEKGFKFGERFKLAGIVDLYNMFNSNGAQNQDNLVGRLTGPAGAYQRFLRPTTIIAPRLLRLGVRLTF